MLSDIFDLKFIWLAYSSCIFDCHTIIKVNEINEMFILIGKYKTCLLNSAVWSRLTLIHTNTESVSVDAAVTCSRLKKQSSGMQVCRTACLSLSLSLSLYLSHSSFFIHYCTVVYLPGFTLSLFFYVSLCSTLSGHVIST